MRKRIRGPLFERGTHPHDFRRAQPKNGGGSDSVGIYPVTRHCVSVGAGRVERTGCVYGDMTHSSVKIFTLRMSTNLPPSAASTETHTGQIGTGGISTLNGFLWMTEGLDSPALLTDWVNEVLRQTDAETQYSIEEGFKRTIVIRTSYLSEVRDILHRSSFWSTTHVLDRSLLYDTGHRLSLVSSLLYLPGYHSRPQTPE